MALKQCLMTQSCSSTPPKAVNGESSSSSTLHKEEELSDQGVGTSDSNLYSNLDWVTCPVCGNNVRAMDYIVNSHLGMSVSLKSL